jgi:hypothetical protein
MRIPDLMNTDIFASLFDRRALNKKEVYQYVLWKEMLCLPNDHNGALTLTDLRFPSSQWQGDTVCVAYKPGAVSIYPAQIN